MYEKNIEKYLKAIKDEDRQEVQAQANILHRNDVALPSIQFLLTLSHSLSILGHTIHTAEQKEDAYFLFLILSPSNFNTVIKFPKNKDISQFEPSPVDILTKIVTQTIVEPILKSIRDNFDWHSSLTYPTKTFPKIQEFQNRNPKINQPQQIPQQIPHISESILNTVQRLANAKP